MMKYSLMSLMIDKELTIKKPSFIQILMMRGMGYDGPEPTAEEMFHFFREHGMDVKNGTMTFRDYVRFAKEKGFDGVDMMSFHFEEDGESARQILEEYGITLSAVNIIAPFADAESKEQFDKTLQEVTEVIDRAYTAGCRNILLMPTGYVPGPGLTREMVFQNMVRGLKACVSYGEAKGMTINTETLESVGVPLCSNGEMLRLFNEVQGLKYTHDTGNPIVAMEDPAATYELLKEHLAAVHFKDLQYTEEKTEMMNPVGRFFKRAILGEGEIDFKKQVPHGRKVFYTKGRGKLKHQKPAAVCYGCLAFVRLGGIKISHVQRAHIEFFFRRFDVKGAGQQDCEFDIFMGMGAAKIQFREKNRHFVYQVVVDGFHLFFCGEFCLHVTLISFLFHVRIQFFSVLYHFMKLLSM